MTHKVLTKRKEYNMSQYKDWFDEHVIIDFGDFNNKEDKKKADDLKDKLKQKLEEELKDESISQ
jgi:hypothetical protein